MEAKTDYIILIHKELTGSITREESAILQAWRQESQAHQLAYEEITQSWELSLRYKQNVIYPQAEELQKLRHRILADQKSKQRDKGIRHLISWRPLRYAASVAIAIGLSFLTYYLISTATDKNFKTTISSVDQIRRTLLSDSSIVNLNKNSTLDFKDTDKERLAAFAGEAFFEIKKNPGKPFIIQTKLGSIEVVGTSFNVRSIDADGTLTVTVSSGRVKVISKSETRVVSPGYQCIVTAGKGMTVFPNKDVNYLSWKTRKVEFDNAPLSVVFNDLKKTYGIEITTQQQELLSCRFTGTFNNVDFSKAMEILEFSLSLNVHRINDHLVVVSGRHCK